MKAFPGPTFVWSVHSVCFNWSVAPSRELCNIYNSIILPRYYSDRVFSTCVIRFITCLGLIFWPITFGHLFGRFLFKFILFCHVYIGYTNISFYEQLIFNTFCCTFLYFYYSRFELVWLHIILYSITFFNFCSLFLPCSICVGCIIYVNT